MGKRMFVVWGVVFLFLFVASAAFAADENTSGSNWKQEVSSDRQQVGSESQEMKQNAQAARQEEQQLKQQIEAARAAGDMNTVQQLRGQLQTLHQQHVQQMQQDKANLGQAKGELKSDMQEAGQQGYPPPRKDMDNNPPGPKGGPGTNWENPPGPQGGPGAGPNVNIPPRRDNDNNPPGPRGGPGTNWENPPGPRGGAGASPNRRNHK